MKTIKVTGKYHIAIGNYSYNVVERKTDKKTGEPVDEILGFYKDMESAMQGLLAVLIKNKLKGNSVTNLREAIAAINEVKAECHSLFEDISEGEDTFDEDCKQCICH